MHKVDKRIPTLSRSVANGSGGGLRSRTHGAGRKDLKNLALANDFWFCSQPVWTGARPSARAQVNAVTPLGRRSLSSAEHRGGESVYFQVELNSLCVAASAFAGLIRRRYSEIFGLIYFSSFLLEYQMEMLQNEFSINMWSANVTDANRCFPLLQSKLKHLFTF